jgi:Fic family protein
LINSSIWRYDKNYRGKFKTQDNQITETGALGHQQVRFTPAPAYLTPQLVAQLCTAYDQAITDAQIDPLILTACFVFDFLSIHPFLDGNGRLSRLLTLLLLYRSGIKVGRYISLEKLIEESKATYYEALQASSQGWLADENDYTPFVRYFLGVILKSYQALETRFEIAQNASLSPDQRVLNALRDALIPQSRRELEAAIPECGQRTIERALARLQVAGKIEKRGAGKGTKYVLTVNV